MWPSAVSCTYWRHRVVGTGIYAPWLLASLCHGYWRRVAWTWAQALLVRVAARPRPGPLQQVQLGTQVLHLRRRRRLARAHALHLSRKKDANIRFLDCFQS